MSYGDNITAVEHVGEHLQIEAHSEPDRVVLELHGELDLLGAPSLEEAIEGVEAGTPSIIVLDLQDLQFVDSAGLRVILSAHERSLNGDWSFALTRGTEQVQRLFTIAGVDDHLRIIDSPDELFG
ncbi:MAG TPA: STAS domain-containing protein [Solirubrobacteraceae bacterium]|jgi:anti-anti-sigma factor